MAFFDFGYKKSAGGKSFDGFYKIGSAEITDFFEEILPLNNDGFAVCFNHTKQLIEVLRRNL